MKESTSHTAKIVLIIIAVLTILGCLCCVISVVSFGLIDRIKQRNVEMPDFFNKGSIVYWAGYDAQGFESADLPDNEVLFYELALPYKYQENTSGLGVTLFDEEAYYNLAEAYIKKNTGRKYDEWALREIQYTLLNCQLGFNGPVTPLYQFVQVNPDLKTFKTPLYEIGIVPWDHVIGSYEHDQNLWWGTAADELQPFMSIPVSAKEAFDIAQQRGGFAAVRDSQSESCEITIRYRYGWFNYWIIRYKNENGPFLTIRIDPQTGDWRVLQK